MPDAPRSSPLALAVLGLLTGGPLHPYGIQRLLREWGKDQVVNVAQRASLYKAINRLHDAGLIAVRQTERDQRYPERTVYELTDRGQQMVLAWLDDMLANPRNEYPQFPAALSFAMILGPAGVLAALRSRADSMRASLAELDAVLAEHTQALPRVTLLEVEYQRAVTAAELAWVDRIVEELQRGALSWTREDFPGLDEAYAREDGVLPADDDTHQ
ncbi:MAG: PadR family transcriptional regulator [Solirubrobacteraceae bacterium]